MKTNDNEMKMGDARRAAGNASRCSTVSCFRVLTFCLLPSAFCLLPSAFCLPPIPPKPSATPPNARQTYDSFRLVHTRNVFDPDRRPVRPPGAPAAAPAPTRADYVALTGIAVDGEKSVAFFSGTRAEFNRVVPAGEQIAGATVAKINPMNIEVERKGRHVTVAVGQTVPLDDKSAPAPAPTEQPTAAAPPTADGHPAAPAGQPAAGPQPGAPATSANLDEIRRRMMERHNQEQR